MHMAQYDAVNKRLDFNISETLTQSLARFRQEAQGQQDQQGAPNQHIDFGSELSSLASSLEQLHSDVEARVAANRNIALNMLRETGGRQAIESHLKAQKAAWKFSGQKEAFYEYVRALASSNDLFSHDFQSDIKLADNALKTIKDDIKERQAAIDKAESSLGATITQLARLYEQGQTLAVHEMRELPEMAQMLEEHMGSKQAPSSSRINGMTEAELAAALASEAARAATLEAEMAQDRACWADECAEAAGCEARVSSLQAALCAAQEEVARAAQQRSTQDEQQVSWCDAMAEALARLHGVRLVQRDESAASITLCITQAVARGMVDPAGAAPGSAAAAAAAQGQQPKEALSSAPTDTLEHLLTLHLYPQSAVLRSAELSPPDVDIMEEVKAAQDMEADSSLPWLIATIKRKLRHVTRRARLVAAAAERYPAHVVSTTQEGSTGHCTDSVLRCVLPLPSRSEVELCLPAGWPDVPGVNMQLLVLQAPSASVVLQPALMHIQEQLSRPETLGMSLETVLDMICSNLKDLGH